jgi:cell wall-associated NlpC family hydrolase
MASAGVAGADKVWMQREPFERWLADNTRPGGQDDRTGTVLVWRSPEGLAQHAAVTLGEGWALHKPSQGWMSPIKVLTTDECKASSRSAGRRLERHTIQS